MIGRRPPSPERRADANGGAGTVQKRLALLIAGIILVALVRALRAG
jgi:hypothetical protein